MVGGFFLFRWSKTKGGRAALDRFQLEVPYVGDLYKKLYLSRIADNMSTMLGSGISVVQATEITASVVDNDLYSDILLDVSSTVKAGGSISEAFAKYPRSRAS